MRSADADLGLLDPVWAGRPVASVTGDAAVLDAIVRFETALAAATGPDGVADRVAAAGTRLDLPAIARDARTGGNPVIPVLAAMRAGLDEADRPWLHRGATSQDALDTALVLIAKDAAGLVADDARGAALALVRHAQEHRDTVFAGRTLTQPSTPVSLGVKLAGWAHAIAAARRRVLDAAAALPVQFGGASGTLAASVLLDGPGAGLSTAAALGERLGLVVPVAPWHTDRAAITRLAEALSEVVAVFGTVGANVAVAARTGELDDGANGGSSAMPHKANPVRAVLLQAAARQAPAWMSVVRGAASTVDERPDGAWHAEWSPLRALLRIAGGAAGTGRELAEGLRVHASVIEEYVGAHADELLSEARRYDQAGRALSPGDYVGESGALLDRLVAETLEDLA